MDQRQKLNEREITVACISSNDLQGHLKGPEDTNPSNARQWQIKNTIQLFRYMAKYPCPVLDMGHHHSVLTDIKDKELSKSPHLHTYNYSITKDINKRLITTKFLILLRESNTNAIITEYHTYYVLVFKISFRILDRKCCYFLQHISPIRQHF